MDRNIDLGSTICWMDNEYTLCCSDGYWFGYIDIREQDKNPEWVSMEDAMELANIMDENKALRSIFL